jgi:hypothetical protein
MTGSGPAGLGISAAGIAAALLLLLTARRHRLAGVASSRPHKPAGTPA